jgi:thiol:disulfide interchange protein
MDRLAINTALTFVGGCVSLAFAAWLIVLNGHAPLFIFLAVVFILFAAMELGIAALGVMLMYRRWQSSHPRADAAEDSV